MANEIQISAQLLCSKNGSSIACSGSKTITMAGEPANKTTQIIGTTTEALALGDVSAPGYVYIKNNDATNFVRIGLVTAVTSGNALITLLPGEFALFPTRQTVIYAIADTAACNVEFAVTSL